MVNDKGSVTSQWGTFSAAQCILLGQLTTYVKKKKNEKDKLKLYTKSKSRWIKNLNMKNLIEDNAEDHFYDVRLEGCPKQDKNTKS